MYVDAIDNDFAGLKHEECETTEKAHGRTTTRNVHVVEIPKDHPQRRQWKDLRRLAVVTTCNIQGEKEAWETRWYVTSHAPHAKALARAIRKHWSIENSQHWVLDIAFGEDTRRQQDRQGAVNFAAVRRLAVSLLRQDLFRYLSDFASLSVPPRTEAGYGEGMYGSAVCMCSVSSW